MIKFDNVTKLFDTWTALDGVSLDVPAGEICALVGTSGSGKSTLLRLVNRLIEPTDGDIWLRGAKVKTVAPEMLRRSIGYVIQSVGLFPHWTVARNIATVPRLLGWREAEITARVNELFTLLSLDGDRLGPMYPHQLSGGQQQRIGVARALAARPDLLLMDEPFGALDPLTRAGLQAELLQLQRETGTTILFVTHDIDEALRLGNRLAVMDQGRLLQVGTPQKILTAPATPFVQAFIGGEAVGLRLLSLATAADRLRPGEAPPETPAIADALPLDQALSLMLARGVSVLGVQNAQGKSAGVLHRSDLL